MMELGVMDNERPTVEMTITSTLNIPPCCPVSTNPRPGSTVAISYMVGAKVLEVGALHAYIQEFVDGHRDGTRNMETMIQKIAQDAADALEAEVRVVADLVLIPEQRLQVICTGRPQ